MRPGFFSSLDEKKHFLPSTKHHKRPYLFQEEQVLLIEVGLGVRLFAYRGVAHKSRT